MVADVQAELRRGSFADGQAAAGAGTAPVGRFSLGQERGPSARPGVTGSFADGQASAHPEALPRGRFSTGQERSGLRRRPAATVAGRGPARRLEASGRTR